MPMTQHPDHGDAPTSPKSTRRALVLGGALAWLAGPALAEIQAPAPAAVRLDKPVRIVVAYGTGTSADLIARFIGEALARRIGQPVIVDNRPGADGNIGAAEAARPRTDAHTLLLSGSSTHAANATLYKKLPFDPEADFTPLAAAASTPYLLLVNPKAVPTTSLKDFLAWAKKSKTPLTFASSTVGSRISGELFRQRTRLEAVNVPYKTTGQAMTDLIGGQFDFFFCDMGSGLPQVQAANVRALAITSARRPSTLPDVPTVAESGLPGFEVSSWIALWSANASTPKPIAHHLARLVGEALDSTAGRAFLVGKGLTPTDVTPAYLQDIQRRDTRLWGKVIVDAGLQMP